MGTFITTKQADVWGISQTKQLIMSAKRWKGICAVGKVKLFPQRIQLCLEQVN